MSSLIIIGITIFVITIWIYIVENKEYIIKTIENKKSKKILNLIFFVFCLFFLVKMYNDICEIEKLYKWYKTSKENDKMFAVYDEKIAEENVFYSNVINDVYQNENSSKPYIPEGFFYVEGSWNNGYVIQDTNGNQYVWVPCTNKKEGNIEKLQRINFSENTFISKDLCCNKEYKEFLISALENGGFYISRFEIGKENNKPVSKKSVEIWNEVNVGEAEKIIDSMYNNINCELINSYAYDTTLSWIINTNNIENNIVDVDNSQSYMTGKKSYNNIFDFIDNVMELTSEMYYSNVVIRGFPYKSNFENKDNVLQKLGYDIENFDRFSIGNEENYFTITTILGFRTIIYK